MQPATRYAKSGDVHVAYQVFGEGPVDVIAVLPLCRTLKLFGTNRSLLAGCGISGVVCD